MLLAFGGNCLYLSSSSYLTDLSKSDAPRCCRLPLYWMRAFHRVESLALSCYPLVLMTWSHFKKNTKFSLYPLVFAALASPTCTSTELPPLVWLLPCAPPWIQVDLAGVLDMWSTKGEAKEHKTYYWRLAFSPSQLPTEGRSSASLHWPYQRYAQLPHVSRSSSNLSVQPSPHSAIGSLRPG